MSTNEHIATHHVRPSCGVVRHIPPSSTLVCNCAAHIVAVVYGVPIHPVREASTPDLVSSYPYSQPKKNTQQHLIQYRSKLSQFKTVTTLVLHCFQNTVHRISEQKPTDTGILLVCVIAKKLWLTTNIFLR